MTASFDHAAEECDEIAIDYQKRTARLPRGFRDDYLDSPPIVSFAARRPST